MNIDNEKIKSWSPDEMLEIYLSEPDDFLKVKKPLLELESLLKGKKTLYFKVAIFFISKGDTLFYTLKNYFYLMVNLLILLKKILKEGTL